jgi:hypothetical protein
MIHDNVGSKRLRTTKKGDKEANSEKTRNPEERMAKREK